MKPDELLKLARDDYDQQQKYAGALVTRLQLNVAIATLIGSASLAMLRRDIATAEFGTLLTCFLLVWVCLLFLGIFVIEAVRIRDYVVPKSMWDYLDWSRTWVEHQHTQGKLKWEAESEAQGIMVTSLINDYSEATKENRSLNLVRQKHVATMTYWLMAAALFLFVHASAFGIILLREAHNAKGQARQSATTHSTDSGKAGDTAQQTPTSGHDWREFQT